MGVIHRIRKSLSVTVESLLDDVENQQALVGAMVEDVAAGAARVRAQRKACERGAARLQEKCRALDSQAAQWRKRALRLSGDRDKAIECLRRALGAEHARLETSRQLEAQQTVLENIRADERAVDDKLAELRRRHAALCSREARALAECGDPNLADIDRVFDRWEAKIEGREVHVSSAPEPTDDAFSRALRQEEEDAALAAEFENLLRGEQR